MSYENTDIILEAKSSGKTVYKCEFCSYRGTKEQLVSHVEKKHPDMIPEGYTAARLVFNHLNKKDHGTCIVCGGETDWREDLWRYDRVHPQCKKEYAEYMKANMKKVYGKENLLNDPEQQEKMLKNRRISGQYRFTDGGTVDYVGSYEKKTLEFLDKAMNVKSTDIVAPGPTIEYEYIGEKHFWITDIYFVPMNLIIEVKDGGDNPNNREMPEYRAKQLAKEQAIRDMKKYNYLRLTNNNFEQLLFILAEIKSEMMSVDKEGTPNYVSHINEAKITKKDVKKVVNKGKATAKKAVVKGKDLAKKGVKFGKEKSNEFIMDFVKNPNLTNEEKDNRRALLAMVKKSFRSEVSLAKRARGIGDSIEIFDDPNNDSDFIAGYYNRIEIGEINFKKYREKNNITTTHDNTVDEIIKNVNTDKVKKLGGKLCTFTKTTKTLFYLEIKKKKEPLDVKVDNTKKFVSDTKNKISNKFKHETAGNGPVGMAMHTGNGAGYLIPYKSPDNNLYLGLKDEDEDEVYLIDDEANIVKESMEYIQKGSYSIYKYKKPMTMDMWGKCTDPKYSEKAFPRTKNFFYEELTGRSLLTIDQLNYDADFEKVEISRIFY